MGHSAATAIGGSIVAWGCVRIATLIMEVTLITWCNYATGVALVASLVAGGQAQRCVR